MPYNYHIDDEARLVTSVWQGPLHIEDISSYLSESWKENPHIANYNELVDLTGVHEVALSRSEIHALASIRRTLDTPTRSSCIAIVVTGEEATLIAQTYASLLDGMYAVGSLKAEVFRDMNAARNWALEKKEALDE